jgi:hypothetical protein
MYSTIFNQIRMKKYWIQPDHIRKVLILTDQRRNTGFNRIKPRITESNRSGQESLIILGSSHDVLDPTGSGQEILDPTGSEQEIQDPTGSEQEILDPNGSDQDVKYYIQQDQNEEVLDPTGLDQKGY